MELFSAMCTATITRKQEIFFSWRSDVLIYVVVLNVFVEYAVAVVIDSFTISILTAVLLKILLDIVMGFEHTVHHFFAHGEEAFLRVIGTVSLFAILFLGKLLILEVVNFAFGDHAELGRFVEVVALVLALMITRRLFLVLSKKTGAPTTTEAEHRVPNRPMRKVRTADRKIRVAGRPVPSYVP